MTSSATKEFQVTIVGGGLVGLTCAIALQRQGVPVQIYEAAAEFSEVGAAIGFSLYALEIARHLEFLSDIFPIIDPMEQTLSHRPIYRKVDSHTDIVLQISPEEVNRGVDFRRAVAHRAITLDALVKHVDPTTVHFNKRAKSVSISSDGRAVVHFQDDTSVETDVLIGADGIRSKVRPYVMGTEESPVKFSNTTTYRGLVATDTLRAAGVHIDLDRPQMLLGKGKHIILVPYDQGKMVNAAAIVTDRSVPFGDSLPLEGKWLIETTNEEIAAPFSAEYGPDSDISKIMLLLSGPNKLPIHLLHPVLESYANGKVALVGDAAHAMVPFLASGASMGFEDAFLLARILGHPSTKKSNIESVLQLYSRLRVPRVAEVWKASLSAGDIFQGYGPSGDSTEGIREDLRALLKADNKRYAHGLDKDIGLAEAFAWLKENL